MKKQCWICKNTEDDFITQKGNLLATLEKDIKACEEYIKNIKEITTKNLGFTEDKKNEIINIPEAYANMSFKTISGDKENFFKLEASLEIIYDYATKYCNHYDLQNIKIIDLIIYLVIAVIG